MEIAEGINAYGVTKHRHMPEIEQGLSDAAGEQVTVSFTPHLMPMSRLVVCFLQESPARTAGCTESLQTHVHPAANARTTQHQLAG